MVQCRPRVNVKAINDRFIKGMFLWLYLRDTCLMEWIPRQFSALWDYVPFSVWAEQGRTPAPPTIHVSSYDSSTLQCDAVTTRQFFFQNIHERHATARPSGRGMGCLLWVQLLIDILPQFLQWYVQYHVILDRVISALDCISTLTLGHHG